MKRILIAVALVLSLQAANAQVKSPAAVKKAVEAAEAASQDPKKNIKPATWLKLAEAYVDAYTNPMGVAWFGASEMELERLMFKQKPSDSTMVEIGGEQYKKEVYDACNFYFDRNSILQIIEVTKPLYEDPLENARVAYAEAAKVDVKKSKHKDVCAGLENISAKYNEAAFHVYYKLGDLAKSSLYFEKAVNAMATEPLCQVDTLSLYNAGFIALMAEDYERSKSFFAQCLEHSYYHEGGSVFSMLAESYSKLGDKEAQVATLEKGFAMFPQHQGILVGLINYYLQNQQGFEKLLNLIKMAKDNEPNNASLWSVEGNVFNQLRIATKDNAEESAKYLESAIKSYDQCAKIDSTYIFGYTGKGDMYCAIADEILEKANLEFDEAKYTALMQERTDVVLKAIVEFEKAYEASKNVDVADRLKRLYFVVRGSNPEYDELYKKYDAIVNNGAL